VGAGRGNSVTVAELLVCPDDHEPLEQRDRELRCAGGHSFPIAAGIPVLLSTELAPTHPVLEKSVADARTGRVRDDVPVEPGRVDPVVQEAIGATNGYLYQ